MDEVTAAKILIRSLDLTSLRPSDDTESITALCRRAQTKWGNVAAVCVYSSFVGLARSLLPAEIKVATVINFPSGLADEYLVQREVDTAIKLGANEFDIVLPYRMLLDGDIEYCRKYLNVARQACGKYVFKLIIESGELKNINNICLAAKLGIDAGADFIKTSTGKTKISATPEAANAILETIANNGGKVGFKASGGIKTFDDAKKYLTLANSIMRTDWVSPVHFRIGASSVLDDILNTIERGF